jgi:hypothetical protein
MILYAAKRDGLDMDSHFAFASFAIANIINVATTNITDNEEDETTKQVKENFTNTINAIIDELSYNELKNLEEILIGNERKVYETVNVFENNSIITNNININSISAELLNYSLTDIKPAINKAYKLLYCSLNLYTLALSIIKEKKKEMIDTSCNKKVNKK